MRLVRAALLALCLVALSGLVADTHAGITVGNCEDGAAVVAQVFVDWEEATGDDKDDIMEHTTQVDDECLTTLTNGGCASCCWAAGADVMKHNGLACSCYLYDEVNGDDNNGLGAVYYIDSVGLGYAVVSGEDLCNSSDDTYFTV